MSIPKIIHYCWFGHNEKSELIKHCIASWRKYCPDWEIIEWNESNCDVNFCSYSKRAYAQKRWGFVTDPIRLKIIYEHGGVYLDADTELIHSLDDLLQNSAWFGYGTDTQINTDSGFGAEKGNEFIKTLLDQYINFDSSVKFTVCTELDTPIFHKLFPEFYGTKRYHLDQVLGNNILILWDIWKYTKHHYTGSWQSPAQKIFNKIPYLQTIYHTLKRIIKG